MKLKLKKDEMFILMAYICFSHSCMRDKDSLERKCSTNKVGDRLRAFRRYRHLQDKEKQYIHIQVM